MAREESYVPTEGDVVWLQHGCQFRRGDTEGSIDESPGTYATIKTVGLGPVKFVLVSPVMSDTAGIGEIWLTGSQWPW